MAYPRWEGEIEERGGLEKREGEGAPLRRLALGVSVNDSKESR